MIKSKDLDVCDACYIFCNNYKSLKNEPYEKTDYLIDDYDDYDNDAIDGDGNHPDITTDVELEA